MALVLHLEMPYVGARALVTVSLASTSYLYPVSSSFVLVVEKAWFNVLASVLSASFKVPTLYWKGT